MRRSHILEALLGIWAWALATPYIYSADEVLAWRSAGAIYETHDVATNVKGQRVFRTRAASATSA